jgi:hypothetical protein
MVVRNHQPDAPFFTTAIPQFYSIIASPGIISSRPSEPIICGPEIVPQIMPKPREGEIEYRTAGFWFKRITHHRQFLDGMWTEWKSI